MSIALTSPSASRFDAARAAARHGGRRLRRHPRPDLALDRSRAGHGGRGLAAHRARRRQPGRARQSRCRRARYRNAGARRHFGAAAAAGQEARPHHHHGVDADPPQRGDQLQGAVARRVRLHSEAGKHARGVRRRHLPPRSDPEDPPSRRQGPPRRRRRRRSRRWRPAPARVQPSPPPRQRRLRQPQLVAPAVQHAGAARAADRLVDRRSAGADDAGRRDRPGDRPLSGADHPAHAADLHHHSRRASGARQPPAGARGDRRRDRQGRPDLSRAGRPPHARRARRAPTP